MFALAKRLLQQTFAAGIAALFFAWYPFSHQTVTWVISPQPQATLFMLLSAILYYDGRASIDPPQGEGWGEGLALRLDAGPRPALSRKRGVVWIRDCGAGGVDGTSPPIPLS